MTKPPLSLLAICLISGCAANLPPTYVRPPVESNATMTVALDKGAVVYYTNGENCSRPVVFSQADNPVLRADRTFVLEGNKRIALQALWVSGFESCNVMVSLTPKANGRYLLSGYLDDKKCRVSVRDRASNMPLDKDVGLQQVRWIPSIKLEPECAPVAAQ